MTDTFEVPFNFDDVANAPTGEGASFEDLPEKAWVLAQTADESNGGAAPSVRADDRDGVKIYKLGMGLLVKGGDSLVDPNKHLDRFQFIRLFIHPDLEKEPGFMLGGRLTGFLNALFAPGVCADEKDAKVRAAERWKVTVKALQAAAQANPQANPKLYLNDNTQQPDPALYLAGLAVLALKAQPRRLLFKTRTNKYTPKSGPNAGKQVSEIAVGTFEDAIESAIAERKVRVFDTDGVVTPKTTF